MIYKLCSTITKPKNKLIPSAKGTEVYMVTLSTKDNEGVCSCRGFTYNGRCKHLAEAEANRCRFIDKNGYEGDRCPLCNEEIDTWEDEIEFV